MEADAELGGVAVVERLALARGPLVVHLDLEPQLVQGGAWLGAHLAHVARVVRQEFAEESLRLGAVALPVEAVIFQDVGEVLTVFEDSVL